MEFLKIKIALAAMFLLAVFTGVSQNQHEVLENAFSGSYALEKEGDFSRAADVLKQVYEPDSYEINLRLGWLNYNAGLFDESVIFYSRAKELKPYSEEARFGLILPKAAQGRWNDVIELYDQILEISPNNTVAQYRLGLVYYGRKEYAKAHALFKKVVDLYPFGYDGLLMLGWSSYFMGNLQEAKVLFRKVMLFNPGDASAAEGLKLMN